MQLCLLSLRLGKLLLRRSASFTFYHRLQHKGKADFRPSCNGNSIYHAVQKLNQRLVSKATGSEDRTFGFLGSSLGKKIPPKLERTSQHVPPARVPEDKKSPNGIGIARLEKKTTFGSFHTGASAPKQTGLRYVSNEQAQHKDENHGQHKSGRFVGAALKISDCQPVATSLQKTRTRHQETVIGPKLVRLGNKTHEIYGASSSPGCALAGYLALGSPSEREQYWAVIRPRLKPSGLSMILLHHVHCTQLSKTSWTTSDRNFHAAALECLGKRELTEKDVKEWSRILSGDGPDDVVHRFLSSSSKKPTFLLLQVLRQDMNSVQTLRSMLAYIWNFHSGGATDIRAAQLEENAFKELIARLLYHTRRLWPAAIVSVSQLVGPYLHFLVAHKPCGPHSLDARTLSRLCSIYNHVFHLLRLPAEIKPLESMVHNWDAQKVLLDLANQFQPSLTLDQESYRAVTYVLAASRKTRTESKAVTLRTRRWPPWRVAQDGMDAKRAPEDDLSRVLKGQLQLREAGYNETAFDQAVRIWGGEEPDGTPTIHTRKLIKVRRRNVPLRPDGNALSQEPWIARVEATRDVQEAWTAFSHFEERGGVPGLAMYYEMFRKLEYEGARVSGKESRGAAPGDGREVMAVHNDNTSAFYRMKLQPPSLEELYDTMLKTGLRPQGRCLGFLVRHARTPDVGFRYLIDSGMQEDVVSILRGQGENEDYTAILQTVPARLFSDILHMLCRFAPTAVMEPADGTHSLGNCASGQKWAIRQMGTFKKSSSQYLDNMLFHVANLLIQRRPMFRPAWYALFDVLARRNIIIDRDLVGDPRNERSAWQVLVVALNNFQGCGLELDPQGFMLVCQAFDQYAKAADDIAEDAAWIIVEQSHVLKDQFAKLYKSAGKDQFLPGLLHDISYAVLHRYIRCMGLVGDFEEIISVLDWMNQHRSHLERMSHNLRLLKRTMIAVRIYCEDTEYEDRARELVEAVEEWGGWPEDAEVMVYKQTGARFGKEHDGQKTQKTIHENQNDIASENTVVAENQPQQEPKEWTNMMAVDNHDSRHWSQRSYVFRPRPGFA